MPRAVFRPRAPALAIAMFVCSRGAVYSGEIAAAFDISESSLKRRRPKLRQLGITFVQDGSGVFYASDELLRTTTAHLAAVTESLSTTRDVTAASHDRAEIGSFQEICGTA